MRVALFFVLLSGPAFGWKLSALAKGFEFPAAAVVEPGTRALFVVEQKGKIRSWKDGKITPVLDWTKKVSFGGECGLLSVAFHPRYEKNGRYFVNYTARTPDLMTYVSEFHRGESTEKVLLKFKQPYPNHNGGQLAFDAKGYLYIGVGDGGSAGDPLGAGQDPKTILAKILRIDVDRGDPYGIPEDNPFSQAGGLKEMFAWGLRNPWRFSFDPKTGKLFVADVGQDKWEEIDIVEKGKNYGWNVREGNHCYIPEEGCGDRFAPALWEYSHDDGQSITGGYVYRGKKIKTLEGAYVYGDYASTNIWALRMDEAQTKAVKNELLMVSGVPISSFALDADGEILVLDHEGGRVLRLDL